MKIRSLLLLAFPVRLFAQSAPTDEVPSLRPPHPEIPPTFWEQHGWWVSIGGIVLLALAGAAVWFLTRRKPPVAVPPDVQARQALEALRGQAEDGATLSRVSQVLRQYVAAAFHLPPDELTTTEFSRAIEALPQVGLELSATISDFLRQCDRRKFSSAPPIQSLDAVTGALQLIEQTEARLAALAQAPNQLGTEAQAGLPAKAQAK